MVLTKTKNEAKDFADALNITAKRAIAASYTGDTKNPNLVLQQFENGNKIFNINKYILHIFSDID